MSVINTNVNALFAQNAMKVNSRSLSTAMEQLSTGSRINSAKDDAAGMSIANTMTSQIRSMSQAVRNANDGISMLQTAEGAMIEQANMLQRMRELAVQSANGTLNETTQRTYLNTEFNSLISQVNSISKDTTWNSQNILKGDAATSTDTAPGDDLQLQFQIGADAANTLTIKIKDVGAVALGLSTDLTALDDPTKTISIDTATNAGLAITAIEDALDKVNANRSTIGAGINRLTYVTDNLNNVIQNTTASRSQIMDTDYATTTSNLARAQIINQAATAMLAQANQGPQSVLALLR
jgi:flagellin